MPVNKLVVSALLAVAALTAQIQAGRIVGTVYDPNKAVVPRAAVVITNTATNQIQALTTNGSGDFVLTPADPGTYRVEVSAKGFGTAEYVGVVFQLAGHENAGARRQSARCASRRRRPVPLLRIG